jgi:hypothetical protein
MSPAGKRFAVAADSGTRPNADETLDVTTSRRQEVARTAAKSGGSQGRTAYTWRLTVDQAVTMDDLMVRLKRELRRGKIDRSEILAMLVDLAAGNPGVFGALVAQFQSEETS